MLITGSSPGNIQSSILGRSWLTQGDVEAEGRPGGPSKKAQGRQTPATLGVPDMARGAKGGVPGPGLGDAPGPAHVSPPTCWAPRHGPSNFQPDLRHRARYTGRLPHRQVCLPCSPGAGSQHSAWTEHCLLHMVNSGSSRRVGATRPVGGRSSTGPLTTTARTDESTKAARATARAKAARGGQESSPGRYPSAGTKDHSPQVSRPPGQRLEDTA